jgi:hypothetical protein
MRYFSVKGEVSGEQTDWDENIIITYKAKRIKVSSG